MTGHPAAKTRTFLFLQGLASNFFQSLGERLAARGHDVIRVNFNAGDWIFWNRPNGIHYRGRAANWPRFFADLVRERGVTDLVLFGDCRPMHRAAIQIARGLLVAVHVVEEGYLRPDWVTLERGGVNGNSDLPRDANWYRQTAATLPPIPQIDGVPSSFQRRAFADLSYNIGAMLFCWLYPFYRTHRPWHPAVEYFGWARRLLGRSGATRRSAIAAQRLAGGDAYFLFPLQLDCDSQIRLHSAFDGMRDAIETVLASFAANAPPDMLLVVKEHPLDNGLIDWRGHVNAVAQRLGMLDRLVHLEVGDIDGLVRRSNGVVTVNSTTGTLALASGVPVMTLGTAIYAIPGLTFQGELAAFWRTPERPDASLFDAFRRVLAHRCLIRGGFFSERGLTMLIDGAVARLEAVEPPRVLPSAIADQVAVPTSPEFENGKRRASALLRS